ncbi:MAG: radical SAM protein [Elusimicrobiota bacterium]
MGLLYLKSALNKSGHTADIFDQRLDNFSMKGLFSEIKKGGYDIVGYHVNSVNLRKALLYIEKSASEFRNKMIMAGGPGARHYEELLKKGCAYVCHGECEEKLPVLLDLIENKEDTGDFDGISYISQNGKVVYNPEVSVTDINSIQQPYWNEHYIDRYGDPLVPTFKKPAATIIASRGCYYSCTFCTTPSICSYRTRSFDNLFREIKYLKETFNIRYLFFMDDLFAGKPGWIDEFCTRMIKEKFDINWFCLLHPLSFLNHKERILRMMSMAGCDCVAFGAQSSNKEILKSIGRHPEEPEELAKSIKICRKYGIRNTATYIIGLPGDTKKTIEGNVDFCFKNLPDFADFHELLILPGSKLEKQPAEIHTKLSEKEILRYCRKSMIRFYSHPKVIWNFLTRILFSNFNFTKTFVNVAKSYAFAVFSGLSLPTRD